MYGTSEKLELRVEQETANGVKYEGQWIQGTQIREGKGKQIFIDGSLYEGWFKADRASGRGRLIHVDGDIYEGQWLDDMANGYGVYSHANGARYEGEWLSDR